MRTLKPLITSRDIRFTVTSALPSHQVDGKLVDLAEDPDSGRKIYPDLGFDSHDGFDSVPGFSGVQYNGNTLPGSATVSESVDLFVVFDADAKEENEEHQINTNVDAMKNEEVVAL